MSGGMTGKCDLCVSVGYVEGGERGGLKRGSGGGVEGVPVLFFLRCCHEVSGRVLMRPRGDLEDSYF